MGIIVVHVRVKTIAGDSKNYHLIVYGVLLMSTLQHTFSSRNMKNINTFGLKKASYQQLFISTYGHFALLNLFVTQECNWGC